MWCRRRVRVKSAFGSSVGVVGSSGGSGVGGSGVWVVVGAVGSVAASWWLMVVRRVWVASVVV